MQALIGGSEHVSTANLTHRGETAAGKKAFKEERIATNQDELARQSWLDGDYARYKQMRSDSDSGRAPMQAQKPPEKRKASMVISSTNRATIIGPVLWPAHVYNAQFEEKASASMLKSIVLADGTEMTGVVREDDGRPLRTGCVRLDRLIEAGIKDENELAASETAVDDTEVGRIAASSRSRMRNYALMDKTVMSGEDGKDTAIPEAAKPLGSIEDGQDGQEEPTSAKKRRKKATPAAPPATPAAPLDANDSDEEVDLLGTMLGAEALPIVAATTTTTLPAGKAKAKAKGKAKGKANDDKVDAVPTPNKPTIKKRSRCAEDGGLGWQGLQKKRREVDKVEQNLLKADQLLKSIADSQAAESLTAEPFDKHVKLLETLIENDILQFYRRQNDEEVGIRLNARLTATHSALRIAASVLRACPGDGHAKKKKKGSDSAADLAQADTAIRCHHLLRAVAEGVQLADVFALRTLRSCIYDHIHAGSELDFSCITTLFDPSADPTDLMLVTMKKLSVKNMQSMQLDMADHAISCVINEKGEEAGCVVQKVVSSLSKASGYFVAPDLGAWVRAIASFFNSAEGTDKQKTVDESLTKNKESLASLQDITSNSKDVKLYRKLMNSIQGLKRISILNSIERDRTRFSAAKTVLTRLTDFCDATGTGMLQQELETQGQEAVAFKRCGKLRKDVTMFFTTYKDIVGHAELAEPLQKIEGCLEQAVLLLTRSHRQKVLDSFTSALQILLSVSELHPNAEGFSSKIVGQIEDWPASLGKIERDIQATSDKSQLALIASPDVQNAWNEKMAGTKVFFTNLAWLASLLFAKYPAAALQKPMAMSNLSDMCAFLKSSKADGVAAAHFAFKNDEIDTSAMDAAWDKIKIQSQVAIREFLAAQIRSLALRPDVQAAMQVLDAAISAAVESSDLRSILTRPNNNKDSRKAFISLITDDALSEISSRTEEAAMSMY